MIFTCAVEFLETPMAPVNPRFGALARRRDSDSLHRRVSIRPCSGHLDGVGRYGIDAHCHRTGPGAAKRHCPELSSERAVRCQLQHCILNSGAGEIACLRLFIHLNSIIDDRVVTISRSQNKEAKCDCESNHYDDG